MLPTWLIVVLVLLIAFGPVLYLLPSARDKRLSRLREHARRLGLTVSVEPLTKTNATAEERVSSGGRERNPTELRASYARIVSPRIDGLPRARLLRLAGDEPPAALPGWAWDRAAVPGVPVADLAALLPILTALPESVPALAFAPSEIKLYWNEPTSATAEDVEQIATHLDAVEQGLRALAAPAADPDSDPVP